MSKQLILILSQAVAASDTLKFYVPAEIVQDILEDQGKVKTIMTEIGGSEQFTNFTAAVEKWIVDQEFSDLDEEMGEIYEDLDEFPNPSISRTEDGGYMLEFDANVISDLAHELSGAMEEIKELGNGGNSTWIDVAMTDLQKDPAILAFEVKWGGEIADLFNDLSKLEAQISAN